jgi:predicted GNAT family acetyltransferase
MSNAVLDIRLLDRADWRILRETRLRALSESPHAFTSRHHVESGWSERQWRDQLTAATWLVAMERGDIIGIAGLVGRQQAPEARHIESIWVAPTHRNRGVFRSVMKVVAEIGQRTGLPHLLLWVLDDNMVAQHAYARLGFVPTGERQLVDPSCPRYELRLRLAL